MLTVALLMASIALWDWRPAAVAVTLEASFGLGLVAIFWLGSR